MSQSPVGERILMDLRSEGRVIDEDNSEEDVSPPKIKGRVQKRLF